MFGQDLGTRRKNLALDDDRAQFMVRPPCYYSVGSVVQTRMDTGFVRLRQGTNAGSKLRTKARGLMI